MDREGALVTKSIVGTLPSFILYDNNRIFSMSPVSTDCPSTHTVTLSLFDGANTVTYSFYVTTVIPP